MLQAYNSACYALGSETTRYTKVHQNDVVRVILDHNEHTISYSVNDSKPKTIFSGVPEKEIFPAIATYGSGKIVQLMKVEVAIHIFSPSLACICLTFC